MFQIVNMLQGLRIYSLFFIEISSPKIGLYLSLHFFTYPLLLANVSLTQVIENRISYRV